MIVPFAVAPVEPSGEQYAPGVTILRAGVGDAVGRGRGLVVTRRAGVSVRLTAGFTVERVGDGRGRAETTFAAADPAMDPGLAVDGVGGGGVGGAGMGVPVPLQALRATSVTDPVMIRPRFKSIGP